MGLIQEVEYMKREMQEQNNVAQRELTEKEKREERKIHENNLILKLDAYFYKFFKNKDNTTQDIIQLCRVDNREKVITEVAENNATDMTYLNKHYEKELNKQAKIFLNSEKATKQKQIEFVENYLIKEFDIIPFINDEADGKKAHNDIIYKKNIDKLKNEELYQASDRIKAMGLDRLNIENYTKAVNKIYKLYAEKSKARMALGYREDVRAHNEEFDRLFIEDIKQANSPETMTSINKTMEAQKKYGKPLKEEKKSKGEKGTGLALLTIINGLLSK